MVVSGPLIGSECCSCQSERGMDQGTLTSGGYPYNGTANKHYRSFNGDCLQQQVNITDSLPYVAGSMVWTLGDYIGESLFWPAVSSSFGAIDLAGFPKAGAQWFAAWWLNSQSPLSNHSRPVNTTLYKPKWRNIWIRDAFRLLFFSDLSTNRCCSKQNTSRIQIL